MKKSTSSMVRSIATGAAACGFLLTTQNAWALPRTHDGFYLQIDAGLGYLSTSAEAGGMKVTYKGLTIPSSLLLGGTVGPVVIGGGFITDYAASPSASINGTSTNLTGVSLYLFAMGVFADFYPDPHSGLHFQPFLGFGGLQASYNGAASNGGPTGIVTAIGGGYDWWVADEWSIGVMGRLTYAPLSNNGVGWSTFSPALLATFTYH